MTVTIMLKTVLISYMSITTMTVRPSFGINFLLFFVHFFNLYFENAFLLRNNKHMLTLNVLRFIHFLKQIAKVELSMQTKLLCHL